MSNWLISSFLLLSFSNLWHGRCLCFSIVFEYLILWRFGLTKTSSFFFVPSSPKPWLLACANLVSLKQHPSPSFPSLMHFSFFRVGFHCVVVFKYYAADISSTLLKILNAIICFCCALSFYFLLELLQTITVVFLYMVQLATSLGMT